mmetsp:Transcript_35513/g.56845  ORF Transcript_35513/g.56845 Transcript_35513/m.56845 type:complete len:587 (+) Transcript_35513:90-1850(+)
MVLKSDFLLDGADHDRLFDFEVGLTKKINPGDAEAENKKMSIKQKEQRFKTVVCRHWVKDLCMKMDDCEYLHELNPTRMPECRWGEKCQVPDCIFKHTKEEDRIECTFYKIGFCRKGPSCRFRHVRRAPEECPDEVDWDEIGDAKRLTVTEITQVEHGIEKKIVVQHNDMYKVAICKHWKQTGDCPFGTRCHFAHGAHELRGRGEEGDDADASTTVAPKTELLNTIGAFQAAGNEAGAPRNPLMDNGDDIDGLPDRNFLRTNRPPPRYFIMRTSEMTHVFASAKYKCWSVLPSFMPVLNEAFQRAPIVYLFFAVESSEEFVGCAILRSRVEPAENIAFVDLPPDAKGCSFLCKVEWIHCCSLGFLKTAFLTYRHSELKIDLPVAMTFECGELSDRAGHALMVMLYREEGIQISQEQFDDMGDDIKLSVHMEGPDPSDPNFVAEVDDHIEKYINYKPPAETIIGTGRGTGHSAGGKGADLSNTQQLGAGGVPVAWGSILIKSPGFVIGSSNPKFCQEMLKTHLFGGPEERKSDLSAIQARTYLLLLDMSEVAGITSSMTSAPFSAFLPVRGVRKDFCTGCSDFWKHS